MIKIVSAKLKGLEGKKRETYPDYATIPIDPFQKGVILHIEDVNQSLKEALERILNYIDKEIEGWEKYKKGVHQNRQLAIIADNFIAHLKELRQFHINEFDIEEE